MSTIVKIRNKKSGAIYAYEQTARWDPEKGQSRPVRKYLGRYDEETDTIIPTSGRRGRKPSQPAGEPAEVPVQVPSQVTAEAPTESTAAELETLRAENARLRAALAQAETSLRAALAAIEGLEG